MSTEATRTAYGVWLWRGDDSHGRFVPDDDSDLALLQAEIDALRTSCDEWRARASNKATDNMDLRAEIAGKDAQIKALEGLISGAIQHSWTPDDYEKFWLAAGKERL